jgi:cytochrome b subunit of formate dehydrogenase
MLLKLLYWLAVLAISLALVVGLILFFESRDQSSVERSAADVHVMRPATVSS